MRRTQCSSCGYDDLEVFLDLGTSPIADAYTEGPDDDPPRYPLQLAVCTGCHLVQLLDVVEPEVLFGPAYSFYSSASPPLSAYHDAYAMQVKYHHRKLAEQGVLEIGCNDGDFLRHFSEFPHIGVDPATGPVKVAEERGLNVIEGPFDLALAERLWSELVRPPGLIFANHVLAHVEDVSDVLSGIGYMLAADGVAYVEVQYLPDLLVNNAFDLVYHEHRNFFSLTSLEAAAQRWGLAVVSAELTDRQGGSLRVALKHRNSFADTTDGMVIKAKESWLRDRAAYHGLQGRAERIRDRLLEVLHRYKPVVGYGAPAKATTLLNYCGVTQDQVTFITDTTSAKQGRYVPGTGIPIVDPGQLERSYTDVVLVLAWNYAGAIMRQHRRDPNIQRWIVPIPTPVVL